MQGLIFLGQVIFQSTFLREERPPHVASNRVGVGFQSTFLREERPRGSGSDGIGEVFQSTFLREERQFDSWICLYE